MADRDAVVVGGGHNGLIAACYLARAGLDVEVVEAEPVPGGQSISAELIADAPGHLVNPCAMDMIFLLATGIIEDLGLLRHGLRLVPADPSFCFLDGDGSSLALWRDPRRTIDELRRYSPRDAAAYAEFARTLEALLDVSFPVMTTNPARPAPGALVRSARGVVKSRRQLRDLTSLVTASAAEAIAERFEHRLIRGLLAEITCAAIGPLTQDGTGMALIAPAFVHRWGTARPVGGMQSLVNALINVLRQEGGSVRCAAPVASLLVEHGRSVGVVLESGEEIRARHGVISTCDPKTTLARLLPPDTLDRRTRTKVDFIPGCASGVAPFKVDMAVGTRVTFPHHPRSDGLDLREPTLLTGGLENIMRGAEDCRAGRVPETPSIWISTPTCTDPSQAPDGHDVLYLYSPLMPVHPQIPWADQTDEVAKHVVATAGETLGGLEREIGRFVENPDDMARRVRTTPGHQVFHVDFTLLRSGPLRPAFGLGGFRTPVPGLFLGGAGCHPGPGVSGVPGKLSANELLRDARVTSPGRRR